jgi:16S rRNA (guanine966-N2)-methyltransferase
MATRPTTDRVREAIFNILAHHDWGLGRDVLDQAQVLDAFAGSGALGLEALSYGAKHVTFWERHRPALAVITDNVATLKMQDRATLRAQDALKPPLANTPCDLIFLDPPYRQDYVPRCLAALSATGWLASGSLIIAETAKQETLILPDQFIVKHQRIYGDTAMHFLMVG